MKEEFFFVENSNTKIQSLLTYLVIINMKIENKTIYDVIEFFRTKIK